MLNIIVLRLNVFVVRLKPIGQFTNDRINPPLLLFY